MSNKDKLRDILGLVFCKTCNKNIVPIKSFGGGGGGDVIRPNIYTCPNENPDFSLIHHTYCDFCNKSTTSFIYQNKNNKFLCNICYNGSSP